MDPVVRRCLTLVLASIFLINCGGGGGGSSSLPASGPGAKTPASSVTINLSVPLTHSSSNTRRAKFIAPTTQSFTITVNGTSFTQNVSACALTTQGSSQNGLSNENVIATNSVDGSVWAVSPNLSGNAILRIGEDGSNQQTIVTRPWNSLGNDSNGRMWGGQTNYAGYIETSGNPPLTADEFASGTNPYTAQPAMGNDGSLYYIELNSGQTPVNALGQQNISTLGHIADVAMPAGDVPEALTSGKDKLLWFVDQATNKIGTFNAISQTPFSTEVAAPNGDTLLPHLVPAHSTTDMYVMASEFGTGAIDVVDFPESGSPSVVATLPFPAYSMDNVSSMTLGSDGAMWFGVTGSPVGSIVRVTLPSGTPQTFTPVDSSSGIIGITSGGDGRIYYLEQDVSKVGILSLAQACSAVVPVPVGTYSLTVNTFDGQNGAGSTLGTYSGSITISPNTHNVVNLTLNGVLSSVKLVPKSTSFSGCGGSAQTVYVQGLDADGNIIVTPGGFVDSSNNPLTITLSSSRGTPMSTSTFASSGVSTLTYAASASNYTDTLTATPSGGGVGPVSLPLLDQGCG